MTTKDAKGFDTSHWQGDQTFAAAVKWADFGMIKACTDTSPDPEFNDSDDHRWDTLGSKIANKKHVARFAYNYLVGGNGNAAADATLDLMGPHDGSAMPAADFEDGSATYDQLLAVGKRWESKEGRKNLVYAGAKLKELSLSQRTELHRYFDLHLADWSAPYATIAPWADWTLLQYVGIGLDLDEFNGDRAALAKYLGTTPTPKPKKEKDAWLILMT